MGSGVKRHYRDGRTKCHWNKTHEIDASGITEILSFPSPTVQEKQNPNDDDQVLTFHGAATLEGRLYRGEACWYRRNALTLSILGAIFVKLYITGQPGPVKLIFQCYRYESINPMGDHWLELKRTATPNKTRKRGRPISTFSLVCVFNKSYITGQPGLSY